MQKIFKLGIALLAGCVFFASCASSKLSRIRPGEGGRLLYGFRNHQESPAINGLQLLIVPPPFFTVISSSSKLGPSPMIPSGDTYTFVAEYALSTATPSGCYRMFAKIVPPSYVGFSKPSKLSTLDFNVIAPDSSNSHNQEGASICPENAFKTSSLLSTASLLNRIESHKPGAYSSRRFCDILQMKPQNSLNAALAAAVSSDPRVRERSAIAIRCVGPDAEMSVPTLIDLLSDSDQAVREAAAGALQVLGPKAKEALPILIENLSASEHYIRLYAIYTLDRMGPLAIEATDELAKALQYPEFRAEVGEALHALGPGTRRIVPKLLHSLQSTSARERAWAALALGHLSDPTPTMLAALSRTLGDEERQVRAWAAISLARLDAAETDAIMALEESLKSGDYEIAAESAKVAQKLGREARALIPLLAKLLASKDYDVQKRAQQTLLKLEHISIPILTETVRYGPTDAREKAIKVLAVMGKKAKRSRKILLKALEDDNEQIRIEAAEALASIAPSRAAKNAVPALLKIAMDNTSRNRRVAGYAIGRFGPSARSSAPHLIKVILNEFGHDWAARSLRNVAPDLIASELLPSLRAQLADSNARIRHRAAFNSIELGPDAKPIVPELIKSMQDDDKHVRSAARSALKKIGSDAALAALSLHHEEISSSDKTTRKPPYKIELDTAATATFQGALERGESFSRSFLKEFYFDLLPTAHGWEIRVRAPSRVPDNFARFPIGPEFVDLGLVEGWQFLAPELRPFATPSDYAWEPYKRPFVFGRGPGKRLYKSLVNGMTDGFPIEGQGIFFIDEIKLGGTEPGQTPHIHKIKFHVDVTARK